MTRQRGGERGVATVGVLSFAVLWFGVFGVFLMNVQLGRHFVRRDVVDHAAAVAADAASKIVCDDPAAFGGAPRGELGGARAAATRRAVGPLLDLISPSPDACALTLRPTPGAASLSGSRAIDVEIGCAFPCEIPIAARAMCMGDPPQIALDARQSTVASGCDVRDGE